MGDPSPDRHAPPSDDRMAPDALHALFAYVRSRRSVRASLAYLAVGWALLEFSELALNDWPLFSLFRSAYLVVYACGFFIVLTGAYLVLSGKHPFRSVGYAVLIVASAAAGIGVTLLWSGRSASGPSVVATEESARPAPTPAPVDTPAPAAPAILAPDDAPPPSEPFTQASMVAQPSGRAATPSSAPVSAPAPRPPAATAVAPTSPAPASSVAQLDPVEARLKNLIARFGESDLKELVDTRLTTMLTAYYQPITVRLASQRLPHTLRVDDPRDRRPRPMRLPNLGSAVRERVTIVTGCGDFPYDVTATVVGNTQVRVNVALDTAAARTAVARAVELGACVELAK